ncbi:MAG: GTPase [Nanoarchaeota archaeon]
MRPLYSFSSRHTGRAKDPRNYLKQKSKYPEVLRKILDQSNIILEIIDSRFIEETRNKELEKDMESKNKIIIYVINKSDLNPELKDLPEPNVVVSCTERKGIKRLRDKIKILAKNIPKNKYGKVVVGVIGYPNTGKSSLINMLIGKNSAKTGSDAGFTKGVQKLRLSKEIVLLDSPGVIPQKEYSSIDSALLSKHTKVSARSHSQIKDPEQVIADLMHEYPGLLEKHYRIYANGDAEILLEKLGKQKNFFIKKNEINMDKTARLILRDWQTGKIKIN